MAQTYQEWLEGKISDFATDRQPEIGRQISLANNKPIGDPDSEIVYNHYGQEEEKTLALLAAYYSEQGEVGTIQDLVNVSLLFGKGVKNPTLRMAETYNRERFGFTAYSELLPAVDFSEGGNSRQTFFNIIYANYILPYYQDNVVSSPRGEVSTEAKQLIKNWIEDPESKTVMAQQLGKMGVFLETNVNSFAESQGLDLGEGNMVIDFKNSQVVYTVNASEIFKMLFNPNNSNLPHKDLDVITALGFFEVVNKVANDPFFFPGTAEKPNVATLEAAIKAQRTEALGLIREAGGLGEPTEEQKLDFRQCALITSLLHDMTISNTQTKVSNYFQSLSSNSPLYSADYTQTIQGNYRVYPVIPNASAFDPNNLVNICTVSKNTKNVMVSTNSNNIGPKQMFKYLYWVYKAKDGSIKEINIPIAGDDVLKTTSLRIRKLRSAERILRGGGTEQEKTAKVRQKIGPNYTLSKIQQEIEAKRGELFRLQRVVKSGYFYLERTTIKYDGTNPSTARNDVTVELQFKLSSMSMLNKVIIRGSQAEGLDDSIQFRLMDLITLPITRKTETKKANMGWAPNENSPDYSRIRLKVKAGNDSESNLLLDLTTIDHKISRESETGEVILTINYRGYFESVLNMPYNDALADERAIRDRNEVAREMDKIVSTKEKCDPKTVRQAMRMQQAFLSRQNRDASASSMIRRLAQIDAVHTYILYPNKMETLEAYVNPEDNYVENIYFGSGGGGSVTAIAATLEGEMRAEEKNDANIQELKSQLSNNFFFLGDLLAIASDCLYESFGVRTARHREELTGLNLRFIVGTIYVPNPKDLNGPPIVINPCSLPIDLTFFIQWFNSSVANKGLQYYPVGTFIRDLIERVVNGVIYDTCFSLVLPDENPPILRTQTFTTTNDKWFKKQHIQTIETNGTSSTNNSYYAEGSNYESFEIKDSQGFFVPNDPYAKGYPDPSLNLLMEKEVILEDDSSKPPEEREVKANNYCVIYQQFPSYFRQLKAGGQTRPLRDNPYVPTIFYGQGNTKFNFLSNVSFSKTDSPHLREARYFNTNYGSLSLLSNVYDLSFSFYGRVGNTLLYPGVVLNFILLDWDGAENKERHPKNRIKTNSDGTSNYDDFGESNPHKQGTMANIMGMGGYFIIKSVEYSLGETSEDFEIKISTKFLGNDGNTAPARPSEEPKQIVDAANCVEAFNSIAKRANELFEGGQEDEVFASANIESASQTNTDGEKNGEQRSDEDVPKEEASPDDEFKTWASSNLTGYEVVSQEDYELEKFPDGDVYAKGLQNSTIIVWDGAPKGTFLINDKATNRKFFLIVVGDTIEVTSHKGKAK